MVIVAVACRSSSNSHTGSNSRKECDDSWNRGAGGKLW